jgi:hypothetical protein
MTAEELLSSVGTEKSYCDKCKTDGYIVVICRSCREEICLDCALKDEQREQTCFACLDKKEAQVERTIYA